MVIHCIKYLEEICFDFTGKNGQLSEIKVSQSIQSDELQRDGPNSFSEDKLQIQETRDILLCFSTFPGTVKHVYSDHTYYEASVNPWQIFYISLYKFYADSEVAYNEIMLITK